MHFWRLAAFVAPFGRFFHDLGRSSLDFGAPSWPYVGTHFALDGIFRHAAGIAAKKLRKMWPWTLQEPGK